MFPSRLSQAIGASFGGCSTRKFHLAAIGIRSDGAVVVSTNDGLAGQQTPSHHAEARLARKLDVGSIVYVARTLKDGKIAMARPCANCLRLLKSKRVRKIYYTISEVEYGAISGVSLE